MKQGDVKEDEGEGKEEEEEGCRRLQRFLRFENNGQRKRQRRRQNERVNQKER